LALLLCRHHLAREAPPAVDQNPIKRKAHSSAGKRIATTVGWLFPPDPDQNPIKN
jgi:hypothetical protein